MEQYETTLLIFKVPILKELKLLYHINSHNSLKYVARLLDHIKKI